MNTLEQDSDISWTAYLTCCSGWPHKFICILLILWAKQYSAFFFFNDSISLMEEAHACSPFSSKNPESLKVFTINFVVWSIWKENSPFNDRIFKKNICLFLWDQCQSLSKLAYFLLLYTFSCKCSSNRLYDNLRVSTQHIKQSTLHAREIKWGQTQGPLRTGEDAAWCREKGGYLGEDDMARCEREEKREGILLRTNISLYTAFH